MKAAAYACDTLFRLWPAGADVPARVRPKPDHGRGHLQTFQYFHNHLVKVVGKLVKFGWVKATSGRNGVRLGVAPEPLQIGVVLQALEGDENRAVADCDLVSCPIAGDCFLRIILKTSTATFYETLNRHTLADILPPAPGRDTGLMKMIFAPRQG